MQMTNFIQFIYFGGQCPWNEWMIDQIIASAKILEAKYELIDLMEQPEYAKKYYLFFPFTTIIDETIKIPSPLIAGEIIKIVREGFNISKSAHSIIKKEGISERIEPLTINNIQNSCALCNSSINPGYCSSKTIWASKISQQVPNNILGFISYKLGETTAVIEFLPSELMPYPIPLKNKETMFITCIYSSDFYNIDYRGEVLKKACNYLAENNFNKISVVSGEKSAFPNGPKDFFLNYGFSEKQNLGDVNLKIGRDKLLYMEKILS